MTDFKHILDGEVGFNGDTYERAEPDTPGRLTVLFVPHIRCPACESVTTAAYKTRCRDGIRQQYRACESCGKKFRVDFE